MIPLPQAAHSHHANVEFAQYVNNTVATHAQPILELLQRKHPEAEHFFTTHFIVGHHKCNRDRELWISKLINDVPNHILGAWWSIDAVVTLKK